MRSSSIVVTAALLLTSAVPASAARIRRGPTSAKHKSTSSKTTHQRAMDDGRATEIQNALVKAGYLPSASGHWDAASEAAMQKMQSDNGWQTKIVPDSRALIKLGLGPNAGVTTASQPVANAAAEPLVQGSK